jgi:tripartite-type tricarboxylate transporter receptor subunit TctC
MVPPLCVPQLIVTMPSQNKRSPIDAISMTSRRHLLTLPLAIACAHVASAASFADRPLRLVVAFPAGGPTDVLARIFASGMTRALGQQVIVDNVAGGGGAIGTRAVARAPADGQTLLFAGDSTLTVLPQLLHKPPYTVDKDFVPLRLVSSQVNVLVANASTGLGSVASLLERARTKPGALTYGSAGNGSPSHLIGALFQSSSGVELTHVPYKGSGPAMTDLLGGQIDLMFVGISLALQGVARKELKLLAVTGEKRSQSLPDVPTFAEAGVRQLGNEAVVWWALMAPAGVSQAIQERLVRATQATLIDPDVQRAFGAQGVNVLSLDAATAAQWTARDSARWAALIKAGKVAVD